MFDWKNWGKGLLVGVSGAAINSLTTTAALALAGTPMSWKMIGAAAGSAALTTLVAYLKQSPLSAPLPKKEE